MLQPRERKVKKVDAPVEKQAEVIVAAVKKPKWKVKSGGITLLDRSYHTAGETFEAFEEDIPEAFMDILQRVEAVSTKRAERVAPKFAKEEVVPTAEEEDADGYVQLYNIVSESGKVITPKLPEAEANAILKELNR